MQRTNDPEGVDPREFLRPIWTHKWLILIVVIGSTALAYAYSERQPDEFTSSTRLFVAPSQLDPGGIQAPAPDDRSTRNQATLVETRSVARAVARRLGFAGDPGELLGAIEVTPEQGSDFVLITATRGNPEEAANVANAFARAFIRVRGIAQRKRIRKARVAAEQELAELDELLPGEATPGARETLQSTIRRYQVMEALPSGSTEQVDRALPSSARSAPDPRRNAAFAFGLSLVFAILAAYGLERFDRRLKHLGQVSPAYQTRLLAALPHASRRDRKRRLALAEPFREVMRGLRTTLQLARLDDPIRTLLVTSAVKSEGKSTLVRNLALAYQESGLRVAVIECDLRRPALAKLMQVDSQPGLTQVLLDEASLEDAVQMASVDSSAREAVAVAVGAEGETNGGAEARGTISVLAGGGRLANPPTVLGADRMQWIIDSAREHYDIVIIDSSPLLPVADTLPLLAFVDGTVLVARLGVAKRTSARHVRELIDRVPGANLLGVVANDVPKAELRIGGYGYGYYSEGKSAQPFGEGPGSDRR
jgi:Mrp family chromosome partitioning ATPase/capsular polysaccharide biosynthesis protein